MIGLNINELSSTYVCVCGVRKINVVVVSKLSFENIIDYCFSFVYILFYILFCVSLDNEVKYLVAWLFLLCFIPLYVVYAPATSTTSASPFSIDYLLLFIIRKCLYCCKTTVLCGANAIFCSSYALYRFFMFLRWL